MDPRKKVGVRIALNPNPLQGWETFRHTLDLSTSSIAIEADDVKVRVWCDACHPVCHERVSAPQSSGEGEGSKP